MARRPYRGEHVRGALQVPAALLVGPWLPWVGPQHRMWGGLSAWEWLAWLAAHMIALLVMMRWGRRVDATTVEPAEDSGRVFGRDWVLQEGTMRWVSAPGTR